MIEKIIEKTLLEKRDLLFKLNNELKNLNIVDNNSITIKAMRISSKISDMDILTSLQDNIKLKKYLNDIINTSKDDNIEGWTVINIQDDFEKDIISKIEKEDTESVMFDSDGCLSTIGFKKFNELLDDKYYEISNILKALNAKPTNMISDIIESINNDKSFMLLKNKYHLDSDLGSYEIGFKHNNILN